MRYTLKFDNQPRIKIDPRGYQSLSMAIGRAKRAVLSGKCTRAEVIGAEEKMLHVSTREEVQAMVAEWPLDTFRWWKRG